MFKLNFLSKENDLNKLIRNNKKNPMDMNILFVSLWDSYCETIVEKLKNKYGNNDNGHPLYIVDSFNMPHSFVIFNTTKLPHLVRIKKDSVTSEDYLPMVMKSLKIK